jgi:hypothetical protein
MSLKGREFFRAANPLLQLTDQNAPLGSSFQHSQFSPPWRGKRGGAPEAGPAA